MRMRFKPYARPELAAWEYNIDRPAELRGNWKTAFDDPSLPLWLELGCGKGGFAAELASRHQEANLIAVDIKSEVLVVAKRTIEKAYAAKNLPIRNVRIMSQEIELIDRMLAPEDRIERIYINFCNPWNRPKHNKKRLTHPRQLNHYRRFLTDGGLLFFKTDDETLFADTLPYLSECGFRIIYLTTDPSHCDYPDYIPTEHEKMFAAEGKSAKFLIAVKEKQE